MIKLNKINWKNKVSPTVWNSCGETMEAGWRTHACNRCRSI